MNEDEIHTSLTTILVEECLCSTTEEASVVAELVLNVDVHEENERIPDMAINDKPEIQQIIFCNIMEYLDIDSDRAEQVVSRLKLHNILGTKSDISTFSENEFSSSRKLEEDENTVEDSSDESSEAGYLLEGECELCDRYIKLTKHHLLPKQTWSRLQTKLLHAAESKENGDIEKAVILLSPGLDDVLSSLSRDKSSIKKILNRTCNICRQCHNAVHRSHSNLELALYYNTVEKLLEDERISKFCQWASKQRTGKYTR